MTPRRTPSDDKPAARTLPRPGTPGAAATPAEAHSRQAASGVLTTEEKARLAEAASREEDA